MFAKAEKSSVRSAKTCSFSRQDAGDETRLFPRHRTNGKRLSGTPRGLEKKTPGRPPARPEIFTDEDRGRNAERTPPEHRFSQAKAWETTWPEHSGPRRRMRLSAHGRARKPDGPLSPHRGRNQKNGRRLRSGMMKKDARFSNKKAARPHENSARTSRLTGKAVSDRS